MVDTVEKPINVNGYSAAGFGLGLTDCKISDNVFNPTLAVKAGIEAGAFAGVAREVQA